MKCENCGSETETKDHIFDENNFLIQITPIEVCVICGEEYYIIRDKEGN